MIIRSKELLMLSYLLPIEFNLITRNQLDYEKEFIQKDRLHFDKIIFKNLILILILNIYLSYMNY